MIGFNAITEDDIIINRLSIHDHPHTYSRSRVRVNMDIIDCPDTYPQEKVNIIPIEIEYPMQGLHHMPHLMTVSDRKFTFDHMELCVIAATIRKFVKEVLP